MKFRCGIWQAGGAPKAPNVKAASILSAAKAWAAVAQFNGEDHVMPTGAIDCTVQVITPKGKVYAVRVKGTIDLEAEVAPNEGW